MKKLREFDERFIKNYNENNDKVYILEEDSEYPENLFNLHNDLSFIPKRKEMGKCKKLFWNIHNKENCFIHIAAIKQALNHRLILKKVQKIIHFNQKAWLKLYIDMNAKLRTDAKKII